MLALLVPASVLVMVIVWFPFALVQSGIPLPGVIMAALGLLVLASVFWACSRVVGASMVGDSMVVLFGFVRLMLAWLPMVVWVVLLGCIFDMLVLFCLFVFCCLIGFFLIPCYLVCFITSLYLFDLLETVSLFAGSV